MELGQPPGLKPKRASNQMCNQEPSIYPACPPSPSPATLPPGYNSRYRGWPGLLLPLPILLTLMAATDSVSDLLKRQVLSPIFRNRLRCSQLQRGIVILCSERRVRPAQPINGRDRRDHRHSTEYTKHGTTIQSSVVGLSPEDGTSFGGAPAVLAHQAATLPIAYRHCVFLSWKATWGIGPRKKSGPFPI
jgi:hypothetical protein